MIKLKEQDRVSILREFRVQTADDSIGPDKSPQNLTVRFGQILIALLILELCGVVILRWPLLHAFNSFAFWDWGGYLVSHYLLQHGQLPVTDFAWQYGLLPLLIQEMWFRLIAASPAALIILSLPCALVFTIAIGGFTRIASQTTGRVLLLLSLTFILPLGADLPHILEPVLLCLALLCQACGRRERALALATAACFTKPSMAYPYGLLLLILIALELQRRGELGISRFAHALIPAIGTALGLAGLLALAFGPSALWRSMLPLTGARAYRILHFGWFGNAWELLYFRGVKPAYYIGTPVTFWLCANLYLMTMAIAGGWHILRGRMRMSRGYEIVFTCAILEAAFIGFFYGPPSSWTYYAYIPVMGVIATDVCAATSVKLASGPVLWGLCFLAAVANYGPLKSSVMAWRGMKRAPATAGLFASPNEAGEWARVTSMVKRKHPALFTWDGAAAVMFPWLAKPVGAFMVPGIPSEGEIQREAAQLRAAQTIIIPIIPQIGNPLSSWPEFQAALGNAALAFKGADFEVYERAGALPARREAVRD
ncbi:MAG: hypothetical protein ACREQX_16790 [Candidatus Binataceae bacterium]